MIFKNTLNEKLSYDNAIVIVSRNNCFWSFADDSIGWFLVFWKTEVMEILKLCWIGKNEKYFPHNTLERWSPERKFVGFIFSLCSIDFRKEKGGSPTKKTKKSETKVGYLRLFLHLSNPYDNPWQPMFSLTIFF